MVRWQGGREADVRNTYSWLNGSLALTPAPLRLALRLWFMRKDRFRLTSPGAVMRTTRPAPG